MASESDNTSQRYETKINYKIISMMVAFAIAYYVYGILNHDYVIKYFTILDIPFVTLPFGVGISGIIVARRYWKTEIFGKAYLSLGISFILWATGSVLYEYFTDFVGESAYPGFPDIFFIAMFFPLYIHLILNIKPFYKQIKKYAKVSVWIFAVAIAIIFTYMTLPTNQQYDFTFIVSEIYVINEAVQLALVILGALVFRSSMLGNVWVLLVIGFGVYTFADYWYYSAGTQYDETHPSNAIWQLSFMILIYALYKHKKAI